jgi:hypothetical protein
MQDHDGNEIAIGNQVKQYGIDDGQVLEVESIDGELCVCKAIPTGEGFNFPVDPPDAPPREYPPDNVRVKFPGEQLVVVK